MIVTETGCIVHRDVQWDRLEEGYAIFKCASCGLDVAREAEDSQG
jgi:hypothetical protein